MKALIRKVKPTVSWDNLPFSATIKTELKKVKSYARKSATNNKSTGKRKSNVKKISLFTGADSTRKTLAAEALAKSIKKELYRIDLSQIVSKYIGETEKNLKKIFNRAENKDWVLFFDEADALFGKRTKVKDSHDRYANIDVNYLIQKIENYPGLVILATNKKANIDDAFLRRLRYIVNFPTPPKRIKQSLREKSVLTLSRFIK